VLNVTVVNPSKAGFLSVRPGDATGSPSTSNLNFLAGVTIPNEVSIGLPTAGGNAGKIQIWYQANSAPGNTHVLVDVVGYYDDHRHDDRYYTKALTRDLVFDQRPMVGAVGGDGVKLDGGSYTSSRAGTGAYSVRFDTIGLGISGTQMPPNITATPSYFCAAGSTVAADWSSYFTSTEVEWFVVGIRAYNAADALADCSFQFHIEFRAPASLAIPEPAAPGALGEKLPVGTPVECRNQPTGPVCKPADNAGG
jgi:hypothetical protein